MRRLIMDTPSDKATRALSTKPAGVDVLLASAFEYAISSATELCDGLPEYPGSSAKEEDRDSNTHDSVRPSAIHVTSEGTVKLTGLDVMRPAGDKRSDVFLLGACFYELLSYRRPFAGDTMARLLDTSTTEAVPTLRELHGSNFAWLDEVVSRCLARDVAGRWASCGQLATVLRERVRTAGGDLSGPRPLPEGVSPCG